MALFFSRGGAVGGLGVAMVLIRRWVGGGGGDENEWRFIHWSDSLLAKSIYFMEGGDSNAAARWRHSRTKALICLACAVVLALPVWLGNPTLERMELGFGDLLTDNRGGGTIDNSLVLIGIDKDSLNVLDVLDEDVVVNNPVLDEMSFGYPFPRTVFAALTEKLLSAGARMVVFDVIFSGERQEDAEFKAVLDAHPGSIVVACNFDFVESMGDRYGIDRSDVTLPSFTVIEPDGANGPQGRICQFLP